MDTTAFFSREQLLGGQPARRASTLLFAVESLVASLAAESRRAALPLLNEATAAAREGAFLSALASGAALAVDGGVDGRQASVALPATGARGLKLWAHRITAAGASEPMAAMVEFGQGSETRRLELGPSTASMTVPFDGKACKVHVRLAA